MYGLGIFFFVAVLVHTCLSLPLGQEQPRQRHQISHHNLQTAEEKSSVENTKSQVRGEWLHRAIFVL